MMDDKRKMMPRIRFRGFEDVWEQHKLGELATLSSSKRIHASDYVKNGIPFFRGIEISSQKFNDSEPLHISNRLYEEIKEKYGVPKNGDILVTAVGTLGNVWHVDNTEFYYKDGNLILISNIKIDSNYLYAYLSESIGKNRMLRSAAGSNQKALTMVKLREVIIDYPNEEEQRWLDAFQQTLSHLIVANEKKVQQLKDLKKLLMQKIFSQNWRFKGFTDPWEQRKLGEVITVNSGKDYKSLVPGNVPVYGTGGYMTAVDSSLSDVDAIGIGRKGTINNPQFLQAPFWTVDTLFFLTIRDKMISNLKFFFYVSENINWKRYDESTGVPSLSKRTIEKVKIVIPNAMEEQVKIAMIFSLLGDLIVANEKKVTQLKQVKKYLMQNMFV